jgi:tRNA pseudouridine55 synthase
MYKTILINKDNMFNSKYLNRIELIDTYDINNNLIKIEKNTYNAYLELKEYLEKEGIIIGISSAFRTEEEQVNIYNETVEIYGEEYAENYVAKPNYSEHQLGLAIDLSLKINNKWITNNNDLVSEEETFKKIHKILYKFGFILRYPKNKENITLYSYEVWHIRYVGRVISKIIFENNWTLEEYLKLFSGVIVINKNKGVTSFDIVNDISHIFGIKKVGHTGTLDPIAKGVLIVAIGKATKIVELLTSKDKEYIAGVKLGIKTDTYDITGKVIDTKEVPNNINLEEVLNSYKKTYLQEVPIYSAVKVNGKKLYDYARNNISVELPKKEVTIKNIELLDYNNDTFTFKALVTKGCYIRSLINDIGLSLSTFATMTSLIRTKQGSISINDTYTIEDIRNNNYKLLKIEEVLDYPIIKVDKDLEFKISNGVKLENTYNISDKVIFENSNDKLLGIYEYRDGYLVCFKNFI